MISRAWETYRRLLLEGLGATWRACVRVLFAGAWMGGPVEFAGLPVGRPGIFGLASAAVGAVPPCFGPCVSCVRSVARPSATSFACPWETSFASACATSLVAVTLCARSRNAARSTEDVSETPASARSVATWSSQQGRQSKSECREGSRKHDNRKDDRNKTADIMAGGPVLAALGSRSSQKYTIGRAKRTHSEGRGSDDHEKGTKGTRVLATIMPDGGLAAARGARVPPRPISPPPQAQARSSLFGVPWQHCTLPRCDTQNGIHAP